MSFARALRCRECGHEYPLEPAHACEFCFGPLEVAYDMEAIARIISRERIEAGPNSMWRYRDLLPCDAEQRVDLATGFTPLLPARRLGEALGLRNLFVKNDCVNPTWSFKDRVVGVASTRAREFGFTTLACASTGNLANSVAAHAANAGLDAFVFIPDNLEQGKIIGSAVYNPTLLAVRGSYDQVNRLCAEVGDKYGWAFVNINVRPYYAEGSKTLGYEVAEQLGWRAPDYAIVPMASGSLFTKISKGLHEFEQLGLIPSVRTRMFGAQNEGCAPIAHAWRDGTMNIRPVKPSGIAKSLAIGNPADGYYALKTMHESDGGAVAVTDEEVIDGIKLLAATEGIFAETAGGVVVAGLKRLAALGTFEPDASVVAFITGAGLKTQEAVAEHLAPPIRIEPVLSAFEEATGGRIPAPVGSV